MMTSGGCYLFTISLNKERLQEKQNSSGKLVGGKGAIKNRTRQIGTRFEVGTRILNCTRKIVLLHLNCTD